MKQIFCCITSTKFIAFIPWFFLPSAFPHLPVGGAGESDLVGFSQFHDSIKNGSCERGSPISKQMNSAKSYPDDAPTAPY